MTGFVPSSCNVTAGACNSTFSQLIDHSNPSLGTFEQFYYWSDEFYGGPGSPVSIGAMYSMSQNTNRRSGHHVHSW